MGNSFCWRRMAGHEDLMSSIGPEAYSMDVAVARDVNPQRVAGELGCPEDIGGKSVCCDGEMFWRNVCVGRERGRSQVGEYPEF